MHSLIKKCIANVLSLVSYLVPLDKTLIVFESGRGLADDNPRAFYDYLVETNNREFKKKFVVSRGFELDDLNQNDIIYSNSFKYFFYMMRAKTFIRSQSLGSLVKLKKRQNYVQLWHGADLKISGYDTSSLKNKPPVSHVLEWDYFIANNKDQEQIIRNQTGYQKAVKVLGMARTDYLVNSCDNQDEIMRLRNLYGIDATITTVFLYAPTHRDWELEKKTSNFSAMFDIANALKENECLLVRYHPLMRQAMDNMKLPEKVFNVSNINNLNHILMISDVLITDYSSIFYDFSLLKRPIIYYNYDEASYVEYRGGFYYSHDTDLPGIVCRTVDALSNALMSIDVLYADKEIAKKNQKFYETLNYMNDGHVNKRLYDFICSII